MKDVAVREDIRDLILDAADRLLVRYGFKKMTMDDLASEVGIAKGTIYLHFGSKEEIALSRIDRVIAGLCKELRRVSCSEKKPDVRLREMLITRVMFRFDNVRHYAENIDEQLAAIRPAARNISKKKRKYLPKFYRKAKSRRYSSLRTLAISHIH